MKKELLTRDSIRTQFTELCKQTNDLQEAYNCKSFSITKIEMEIETTDGKNKKIELDLSEFVNDVKKLDRFSFKNFLQDVFIFFQVQKLACETRLKN